jgi:hypothetical protein
MKTAHQAMSRAVGSVMREHLSRIADRLRGMDARLDALESQARKNLADAYCGVYREGEYYERGALATHGGGLWLCMETNPGKPGATPGWRLIVKRGQTG